MIEMFLPNYMHLKNYILKELIHFVELWIWTLGETWILVSVLPLFSQII